MTTTSPEDAAAMFDLPPLPAASLSAQSVAEAAAAAEALEAAEAALAAELASAIESGGVAADAPDSRAGRRVKVLWPARMRLPDGRVLELRVRDISEGGVGLTSDECIPSDAVVNFEMRVPPLDEVGATVNVEGKIKTTYTMVHGSEFLCGGTWVEVPAAGRQLVSLWIGRLR